MLVFTHLVIILVITDDCWSEMSLCKCFVKDLIVAPQILLGLLSEKYSDFDFVAQSYHLSTAFESLSKYRVIYHKYLQIAQKYRDIIRMMSSRV